MKKRAARIWWLAPVLAFFLNPSFACGPADPAYQFGATEMRAAIEGKWSFTIVPTGSTEARQVTVDIAQAMDAQAALRRSGPARGLIRSAHACGGRTLVKSAHACIDATTMPLAVTFASGDAAFATVPMTGTFRVDSLIFTSAAATQVGIRLGDYVVDAQISPDGRLVNPTLSSTGASGKVSAATKI